MEDIIQKTIGEIAAESPAAIGVFERFGIDYCCGGRRALGEACEQAGITIDDFHTALMAAPQAPERGLDWSSRTLIEMHAYLVDRYHQNARAQFEVLDALVAKVVSVHGTRHMELRTVEALVRALQDDMLPHMMKEEAILFPYVDRLENEAQPGPSCFGTVQNPIRVMQTEHEAVGELLRELRSATNDYTAPDDACFSYRELYRRLDELEQETHEHIHLENNVYFPRAVALETI